MVFVFDKTYEFKEIHPAKFGYDFSVINEDLKILEVLVSSDKMQTPQGMGVSYYKYDVQMGGNSVGGTNYGVMTNSLRYLEYKIHIEWKKYTIRQIHGGVFSTFLSENLINKVTRIVFLVNDWILIDKYFKGTKEWKRIDDITSYMFWENYGLLEKTFYKPKNDFLSDQSETWRVNLFDKPLYKKE